MIQEQTSLRIVDNSGAKTAKCIKVLRNKSIAQVGDLIVVSVTAIRKINQRNLKIKKGSVFLAIVVGVRRQQQRRHLNGIILTEDNSICLLNKQKKLLASRINKPVSKEIKKKKLFKLATISFAGFF